MSGDFYNRAQRVEGLAMAIHDMAGRADAPSRTQHVVERIAALDRTLADDLLTLCARRALSDPDWREASELVEMAMQRLDDVGVEAAAS
jgi:hypothetical protein